jgi:hypothetical protein
MALEKRILDAVNICTKGVNNMVNTLAILNGRVGALMVELEQAESDEEREIIREELEAAQDALAAA